MDAKNTTPQATPAAHDHGEHAHDHDDHGHKHSHGHDHADQHDPAQPHAHAHGEDSCCAPPDLTITPASADGFNLRLRIPDMDCAAEESVIRRALEPMATIRALRFELGARVLSVDAPENIHEHVVQAIKKAGFVSSILPTAGSGAVTEDDHAHGIGEGLPRLIAALTAAIGAELLHFFAPETMFWEIAGMALAALAILLAGFSTYRKGLRALMSGTLNINALMTVAVSGAFVIGQWPEAAMVMALYAIAELIEARAVDRARNAIKGLMALSPETAVVQQADGSWQSVAAKSVAINALVRLRPGERVPLDGTVVSGNSSINQAPVTGESIPVEKNAGDPVFTGTINEQGELLYQVTAPANDSMLARIIHAMEVAQSSRAPTQQFVDRFAAIYTPLVFLLALAVALLTPWLLGWTWMQALYKALVLLVIACPCALVIATPVTVVSALAAAAKRGILIKGGTYLEGARHICALALDKTGTLTEGKPSLVHWQNLSGIEADNVAIAHSLAGRSDHPVSKAIAQGLPATARNVDAFTALAGRGVNGVIDGKRYELGNHRLAEERKLCTPELEQLLSEHEAQGRSVTLLLSPTSVLALFAVADKLKPQSRDAVSALKALGVTPVMLSGDNQLTAETIGREVGLDAAEVRGSLLPEHKLDAIKALQTKYGTVAMTGDGINDAPALAQANIGFAMGGNGTDIAMEAADVVIMNDNLQHLPETIALSRHTHSILWQNIALALGIKAVFLVLAVFGNATMWMAVFADMGASLLVVANGLRMLRWKG